MAPSLAISLRDSGKSRADLWAFAAIVATEYGIETNNMLCDGTFNSNPEIQCSDRIGTNDCRINLSRSLKFQTGRKDCISDDPDRGYVTYKDEVWKDFNTPYNFFIIPGTTKTDEQRS